MIKDAQKLDADMPMAQAMADEAIETALARVSHTRTEARKAEAALTEARRAAARKAETARAEEIADDVHRLLMQGVPENEIETRFKCSKFVYFSARKIGERNASEREAEAQAQADAALTGGEILAAQPSPDAAGDAGGDEKGMLRGVADALAQIIGSALKAHGIKVVNNKINRSVNKNRGVKRCGREQPTFGVEFGTDWRPEDGILTPPSLTAASAATADEISSLHAVLARAQATIAMAQAQLDSMTAAKPGKP